MNNQLSGKCLMRLGAVIAGLFLLLPVLAQTPPEDVQVEQRYLFIFCTSKEMKPRIPATQNEINTLLSTALRGEIRPADSVGVWTFGREVHAGQFPLLRWMPDDAASIAAGINKFVGKQSYSQTNDFRILQSYLQPVIDGSTRLTVLIFSDGESPFVGSPYDLGINSALMQRQADLKKSKEPFVVVLRTQQGKYVGCSINFPPGMVSLPPFPPLPPPPSPAAVVTAPPKPVTPLVIVGTRVETNWEAYRSAVSNPARPEPSPSPRPETNAPAPATAPAASAVPANSATTTNTPAAAEKTGGGKGMLALVMGVLIGGIALAVWLIFRSGGGDGGSLISRSMEK